ncbi:MAG TPA: YIP1 family protein [Thermoanaerobaculia bacterium]|nr:YIP1 family protein [Thermoanaerobaculia bacterium]
MTSAPETPAPAPRRNPLARIAGLVTDPAGTMREVAERPDWLVPLLIILVISVTLNVIAVPRVDFEIDMREQLAKSNLSEQEVEEAVERVAAFQKIAAPVTAASVVIILLALSALYLLLSRIFGGEGTFRQFFAVTCYAWMVQLVKSILAIILLIRAGTVTADQVGALLKSNLAFLADPSDQPMLYAVLSSIDLFNFAALALMVLGFGHASRLGKERFAAIVIASYVLWILVKVGFASLRA